MKEQLDPIEQERIDRLRKFSDIWMRSRADAGVSQEYLANEIDVSRKTVQNWERGISSPTFFQGTEWFRVLGLNPIPYYLEYLFPDSMKNVGTEEDEKKITEALLELINSLPKDGKRRLLYLLYGDHGSSPNSVLNLLNAHLQTPMSDRIMHANMILSNYELEAEMNNLSRPDHIQPDTELLHKSISCAKTAVLNNQSGYSTASDIEN